MSNVINLQDWIERTRGELPSGPLARAIEHLMAARCAREGLDATGLRKESDRAAELLRDRTGDDIHIAVAYARAVELAVEAELNDDRLDRAAAAAEPAFKHVRATAKNSVAEVMMRRVVLTVRELSGAPDQAIRTFASYAAVPELSKEPLERLRYLQHVLTCAKRCRQQLDVVPFVKMALNEGMEIARSLEDGEYRPHVACFLHVAGYTNVRFELDADLAVELLTDSLEWRPDTPRDRATRGMGEAERLLAQGDRAAAIEGFDRTLTALAGTLPRHHRSGREMLRVRRLVAA
jgi:hypothetical protein